MRGGCCSLMRSIVHDAALRYAELGYPVFPCVQGEKHPQTTHGYKDASTDPEQIVAWWDERPAANIGIPTEGLLVLDIEAEATWLTDDLEKQLDLAVAPMSTTASGGRHYVFRQPADRDWRNTTRRIAPYVDTRANGGLFVAPPSALPQSKAYRWAPGMELDGPPESLPLPPDWLVEILDSLDDTTSSSPRDAICGRRRERDPRRPAERDTRQTGGHHAACRHVAG